VFFQRRFEQQCQHMTARRPAENAEFMLHANHVHVRDVQEIRRAQVGGKSCSAISKRTSAG
jgi:hypothetical protein